MDGKEDHIVELTLTKADNGYVIYVYNDNVRITKVFTTLDEAVDFIREVNS